MIEYALLLAAMNAPRHQWPVPPAQKTAPSARVAAQTETYLNTEHRRLQRALQDFRKHVTGNMRLDREMQLYVPEIRPGNPTR